MDNKDRLECILMNNLNELDSNTIKKEIFSIIPELEAEDGFDQKNPWHVYDVWNHTVVSLKNSIRNIEVRVALLLHDIGKPYCYQENGQIRHFKGHSQKSYEIAQKVLERLGYDNEEIRRICYLIKNHSTMINKLEINKNNVDINKKLLHIQYCDASAYNLKYTSQVFEKLDEVKKSIQIIENNLNNDLER